MQLDMSSVARRFWQKRGTRTRTGRETNRKFGCRASSHLIPSPTNALISSQRSVVSHTPSSFTNSQLVKHGTFRSQYPTFLAVSLGQGGQRRRIAVEEQVVCRGPMGAWPTRAKALGAWCQGCATTTGRTPVSRRGAWTCGKGCIPRSCARRRRRAPQADPGVAPSSWRGPCARALFNKKNDTNLDAPGSSRVCGLEFRV